MPSPTMATRRPSRLELRDARRLLRRQDLGDDVARCRPARATASAVRAVSPVSIATSSPGALQLRDSRRRVGADGVGDGDAGRAAGRRRATSIGGLASRARRSRAARAAPRSMPSARQEPALPTTSPRPSTDAAWTPRPAIASNSVACGAVECPRVAASADDGRAERVLASRARRPRPGQQLVLGHAGGGDDSRDARPPERERAGLVEDDRVDALRASRAPRRRGSGCRARRRGRCRP